MADTVKNSIKIYDGKSSCPSCKKRIPLKKDGNHICFRCGVELKFNQGFDRKRRDFFTLITVVKKTKPMTFSKDLCRKTAGNHNGISKFTPAPWHFHKCKDIKGTVAGCWYVADKDLTGIVQLDLLSGLTVTETKANAHLIAAAPEMYQELSNELKELESRDRLIYSSRIRRDRIRKLLSKARGEA